MSWATSNTPPIVGFAGLKVLAGLLEAELVAVASAVQSSCLRSLSLLLLQLNLWFQLLAFQSFQLQAQR